MKQSKHRWDVGDVAIVILQIFVLLIATSMICMPLTKFVFTTLAGKWILPMGLLPSSIISGAISYSIAEERWISRNIAVYAIVLCLSLGFILPIPEEGIDNQSTIGFLLIGFSMLGLWIGGALTKQNKPNQGMDPTSANAQSIVSKD